MNDVHTLLRRSNTALAFLLKVVQYEDGFFELDGVDGPVGSVGIIFDDLQHSGASEAFQNFSCVMMLSVLGRVERVAKEFSHPNGKRDQVFLAAPDREKRLLGVVHTPVIPEQG